MLIMGIHLTDLTLILLLVFAFTPGIYAKQNIENAEEQIQPAIVGVSLWIKAELTIKNDVPDDFKSLVGRSYTFNKNKTMNGIVASSDGYVLFDSSSLDTKTLVKEIINSVTDAIIADSGRIDHFKKYGKEIRNEELVAYKEYLFSLYNGSDALRQMLFSNYLNQSLEINIEDKEIYVILSNGSTPLKAHIIDHNDNITLLKIEKINMPVIELKNTTIQNGDEVFAINQTSYMSDLVEMGDDQHALRTRKKDTKESLEVITNENGEPIALWIDDKIITKNEIDAIFSENNITEKTSLTNIEFKNALESYNAGDTDAAKQRLEATLKLYPEHKGAKEYLNKIENMKNENSMMGIWADTAKQQISSISNETRVVIGIILIFMLSLYVINKLKGRWKHDRRHNQ